MAVGTAEVALADFFKQTQALEGVELKRVLEAMQQFQSDPNLLKVLTGWIPGFVTGSPDENHASNEELGNLLARHGHDPQLAVGCSPDRRWCEEGFLVSGKTRSAAAELGDRFCRSAVFEVTDEELLVIRSRDGRVMRRRARRQALVGQTEATGTI